MRKYWKKGIVIGLGVMFLLEIDFSDVKALGFTSYAKGNEEIFSEVEWNSVEEEKKSGNNSIYAGNEMILSGETESDFAIDENGVLTKYNGDGGDVVIPDGVTEIGERAFEDCSNLTSVTIPEGVTSIGEDAFYGCSNLTSVTIPEGVTEIGLSAFYGCSSLTSVTIPEGVTSIGRYAFYGCSSLMSVTIPEGVTEINNYTFYGCSSLTSVTIPEGVTSIGRYAFYGCSSLMSVTIPEGVTEIGGYAFEDCSSLTSVTIPEGVTEIEGSAFWGCSNLTSVTIPEGVTEINNYTFYGCSSLTSVTIPEGVTEIEGSAFWGCSNLTSVTIPEGVTEIRAYAFYGCSNLTIYCYANSYAETYAINNNIPYKLIGMIENPSITTTDIPKAVQYVPYSVTIENNNQDSENKVRYSLKEGSLPSGMELKENGELYGVPKEVGKFTFTIIMENSSDFPSSEKTYTLVVVENTDETVDSSIDQGYNLTERVPDIDLNIVESQTLVSRGEFNEFRDVYLDGTKLIRDEDYVAEEGSTKITIRSQTLTRVGEGTHTIALEFETNTGLKRVAQNYTVSSKNDSNNDNDDDSENGSNQDKDDINNGSDNNDSDNNESDNNSSSNNNSGSEDDSESKNEDESNDNSSDDENEIEDDTLNIYSEDLWVKDRVGWRYKKPNGAWLLHTWCKLPYKGTDEWYYFNEIGYMVTGWLKEGESWYYLNPLSDGTQGKMYIGWKLIDGNWCYFNEEGVLVTNTWYQLPYKGTNEWYYFNEQGYMVTGWLKKGENWYYLNPQSDGTQGKMYTGWILIDEKWYYFNEVSDGKKGSLVTNSRVDSYYVDENGVWIEKE